MNLPAPQPSARADLPAPDPGDSAAADAPVKAAELQRLSEVLLHALLLSGYATPEQARTTEEKLRRMIRRLQLNAADAEVLLGMLRKILWQLEHPGSPSR